MALQTTKLDQSFHKYFDSIYSFSVLFIFKNCPISPKGEAKGNEKLNLSTHPTIFSHLPAQPSLAQPWTFESEIRKEKSFCIFQTTCISFKDNKDTDPEDRKICCHFKKTSNKKNAIKIYKV